MYVDLRACKPPFSESNRMAFPPSALPEYLEGRTPKEKRSMHFCLAGGMRFEKGKGVFLSGLPPYSAACGGQSWHGIGAYEKSQATTRSARAKWVRAWVRISSWSKAALLGGFCVMTLSKQYGLLASGNRRPCQIFYEASAESKISTRCTDHVMVDIPVTVSSVLISVAN